MLSTALLLAASMVVGQAESERASFLPKDVVAHYRYVMGTWAFDQKIGDEINKGETTFRWALGRHCYVMSGTVFAPQPGEPEQHATLVGGYDPTAKQTIEKVFWSDGTHYTIFYDTSNPIGDKGLIKGEVIGREDGKTFETEVLLERKGPEEFVYRSLTVDGKPIEVLFHKTEKRGGKKAEPRKE